MSNDNPGFPQTSENLDLPIEYAEATVYLAQRGVAAKEFPLDTLERLQYLLTTEPDAGCRVWPDPTWDPNECQEACDEHFRELDDLKAYIKAFRQGGVALAETTIAARQLKESPEKSQTTPFFDPVELAKFASTDHRTATQRGLDFYRQQIRQATTGDAQNHPPAAVPEPRKDGPPL